MDKLELKHIAPYLPYGLQFWEQSIGKGEVVNMVSLTTDGSWGNVNPTIGVRELKEIKPLLLPLSFMLEDIICEQFFEDDSELLGDEFSAKQRARDFIKGYSGQIAEPIWFWEMAYKYHIDIDAGLALNKNDYIK